MGKDDVGWWRGDVVGEGEVVDVYETHISWLDNGGGGMRYEAWLWRARCGLRPGIDMQDACMLVGSLLCFVSVIVMSSRVLLCVKCSLGSWWFS